MDLLDLPVRCSACGELLVVDVGFCSFCGRFFCGSHLTTRNSIAACPACDAELTERLAASEVTDAEAGRLVALLSHDLLATVGPGCEGIAIEAAERLRLFVDTMADYELRVVEDVQQSVHDEFIDTAWPACPLHRNHPLWYSEGWWHCPNAGPIFQLGKVAAARG